MEKLRKSKLYGGGLVPVAVPGLRERYNACLADIGLAGTELVRFTVDGAGWSPEIAAEKQDPDYLGQSETNRLAIIVSPDQCGKPLYAPKFSFEREILHKYFDLYSEQIADITTDAALWIEFDFGLSQLRSPLDLLLIDHVNVRTYVIGEILKQASEQRELCQRFLSVGEAWFNDELRQQIIDSANQFGDLRQRRVDISEMAFTDTRQFHCRAFGGVFVFRGLKHRENVVIVEDAKQARKSPPRQTDFYSIPNPSWRRSLHEEGILGTDFSVLKEHPEELLYLQECLLVDAVSMQDPKVPFERLTAARKQTLVHKHERYIPKEYFELERLAKSLERAGSRQMPDPESDLHIFMSHPSPNLPPNVQALVWQLISKVCRFDVAKLYKYDKPAFYVQYQDWPENKQRWAVAVIQRRLQRAAETGESA